MKKQILGIILGILLIGLTSAMYAGECESVDLGNFTSSDNVVYFIVGNSSNLDGMNITLSGIMANICFAINYKPDNFTLIFLDNSTKEVDYYYSGGGGTKIIYIENKTFIEVPKYINYNNDNQTKKIEPLKDINLTKIDKVPEYAQNFANYIKEMKSSIFLILLIVLIIWELFWKGLGLWKSRKNKQTVWFIIILIFITIGILPIIYLIFFQKE